MMTFDEIRDGIGTALNSSCHEKLLNAEALDDTSPGHYGIWDVEIDFSPRDMWVDVKDRSFKCKKAQLSFHAQLGASSDEFGFSQKFSMSVPCHGKFSFQKGNKIEVTEFSIDESLDLFAEPVC
jgi:hypothetical protein